jgi:predicted deacylase
MFSVRAYRLADGRRLEKDSLRFHGLRPGDTLWPGQPLAQLQTTEWMPRRAMVRAPKAGSVWMALEVGVKPGEKVDAGEVLAILAPMDRRTHEPLDLIAELDIEEKHCGDVAPGQRVFLKPIFP